MLKRGTPVKLSHGYYHGVFQVLKDGGRVIDLQRLTRIGLGEYVTIRRGSQKITKPRANTLRRKDLTPVKLKG